MKYLYYILAIVVAATLLSLFFLWPEQEVDGKDPLFTINGQKYTRESITSQYSKFGYHSDNKSVHFIFQDNIKCTNKLSTNNVSKSP